MTEPWHWERPKPDAVVRITRMSQKMQRFGKEIGFAQPDNQESGFSTLVSLRALHAASPASRKYSCWAKVPKHVAYVCHPVPLRVTGEYRVFPVRTMISGSYSPEDAIQIALSSRNGIFRPQHQA